MCPLPKLAYCLPDYICVFFHCKAFDSNKHAPFEFKSTETKSKGQQLTPALDYGAFDWNSPAAGRRSIYRVVWRGISDPFMESLDFPDLGLLVPKRRFSVSALQSLALYNNEFVLHASEWLAARLEREKDSADAGVRRAVELVWLRKPTVEEHQAFIRYVESHGLVALCRVLFNSNEFLFVD